VISSVFFNYDMPGVSYSDHPLLLLMFRGNQICILSLRGLDVKEPTNRSFLKMKIAEIETIFSSRS